MNVALDVHVVGPSKEQIEQYMHDDPHYIAWISVHFDPKQARHVYDMATLYESEEDQEGHVVLLVANDLGKLTEVPADECVVHRQAEVIGANFVPGCAFAGCMTAIYAAPYAARPTEVSA